MRDAFGGVFMFRLMLVFSTGDAVIGIHASVHPAGMFLDELAVVYDFAGI